jgi:hypothetical protein
MRLTLLILGSLFSALASADIYKCTDANGKIEYRSSPCKTGHDNVKINIKTGAHTPQDGNNSQAGLVKQQAELEKQKREQEQALKKQADSNKGNRQ